MFFLKHGVYDVITVQMAFHKLQIPAREQILATTIHCVACKHIKGYRRRSPRVIDVRSSIRYRVRVIRNHKKLQTLVAGLWSRSRRLGLETVSRCTNVSSRSRLEINCQRLGLGR